MAITNARILIRRGLEADFNPDGLQPGEWALSVDKGKEILRVCVSPGEFIRIATYESFEKDMAQIEAILAECKTIEEAVKAIQSEINAKEVVFERYVQQAKGYSETAAAEASKATTEADRAESEADRAKTEADRASSIANIGIATTEKAGIVKPDGETLEVDADGTMRVIGGGGVTDNYENLNNKPSINNVELSGNKTTSDLGITAESVGADAAGSASTALANAKAYTNQSIANLVDGAPEALNTLKEISDALAESGEAVEAINQAIGNKLDKNGDSKDNTVTFTQASTRENIASTEKHSTLFGKIAKWFADLKTVAFSGSYNDLSNKPTIPTVNNATLTIKKNGSTVQTFTANASSNKTANIIVPTKTSELENDSGFMGSATALDTYEEIMANTKSGKFAGAKGVKEGFIAINDNLENILSYSTNEEIIGKWIDGKPIYRFVFEITMSSGINVIALNMSNKNIKSMIDIRGYYDNGIYRNFAPYYLNNNAYMALTYDTQNKNIVYSVPTDGRGKKATLTVLYTKAS